MMVHMKEDQVCFCTSVQWYVTLNIQTLQKKEKNLLFPTPRVKFTWDKPWEKLATRIKKAE